MKNKPFIIGDLKLDKPAGSGDTLFGTERKTGKRFLVSRLTPPENVDRSELQRRIRQLQARLRKLNHPNVVVPRLFSRAGNYYIAREHVQGRPLKDVSELPADQLQNYVSVIEDALQTAHKAGIAHGDLSPENIIITQENEPLLVGLGEKQASSAPGNIELQDLVSSDVQFLENMPRARATCRAMPPEEKPPAQEMSNTATASVHTSPEAGRRFVNTWFEADELPLHLGQSCRFSFNIGPRRGSAGGSAPFCEPDFGNRNQLELLATLFSDDFKIAVDAFEFVLMKTGATQTFTTPVEPIRTGANCSIEIRISLLREKQTLQVLVVSTEVTPAIETVSVS